MPRFLAAGSALLLAIAAPVATAQSTPEAAANAMGETVSRSDWAAVARAMHPDALRQLRQLFSPFMSRPGMEGAGPQLFDTPNAEFESVPDTILFARFLSRVMGQLEGSGAALRGARFTALGHVAGGADTVLVVSRMVMTYEGVSITQFDIMPLRFDRGKWWGLLKTDFTNIATMLQNVTEPPPVIEN